MVNKNTAISRNATSKNTTDLIESLVEVRRVSKVTKGGKRFGFRVIVIVGDGHGSVGYGLGKHSEVLEAKAKAVRGAKKNIVKVSLRENRTLHHEVRGKFGSSIIFLKPAKDGTGIIAGSALRKICDALGIKDIIGKSYGSSNPSNIIRNVVKLLCRINHPRYVASKRGKRITDIVQYREIYS